MKELEKIILLFIQINDENYKFIEQYENIGKNFEYFAKQLIMKSSNLWQYLYDNKLGNEKYIDQWILRYLNLPNSFKNVDEQFNDYINNHKDFFKIAPKEQMLKYFESLKKLDIKFNNLDYNTDIELLNEVYKNNLYELNIHMITILLKQFNIKYDDVSQKLITTIYENSDLELMKAYIEENFSEFFNNCYLKIEKLNDILPITASISRIFLSGIIPVYSCKRPVSSLYFFRRPLNCSEPISIVVSPKCFLRPLINRIRFSASL